MFSISPSLDVNLIETLLQKTEGHNVSDLALIIHVDGEPVGVATASFKAKTAVIEHVGILEAFRKQGYGDALTRTLLLKLSEIAYTIVVNKRIPYFTRFGFVESGDSMTLDVTKLTFPSACKHN